MTREEAKRRLLDIERCTPIHTREDARDFEALEMAIKALEQEPCEDCRNCKKWDDCECGRKGHINGTSIGYSIGECKDYEPSGDLISRQAVLDVWHTSYSDNREENEEIQYKKIAFELPSVNPQEPKTGHWIADVFVDECSVCGEQTLFFEDQQKNYCPNCGARMESEDKE